MQNINLIVREPIKESLIYAGEEAVKKLSRMGLTYEILSNSVLEGYVQKQRLSQYAPPLFRGLSPWGHTAIALREQLIQVGWTLCDEYNLNRTISPNNDFTIVVSSGNAGVGKVGYAPSTLNRKGELSNIVIDVNNEVQLTFFPIETNKTKKYNISKMFHWFLLYYNDGEKLWLELSLPRELNAKGRVSSWFQRIVLPPVDLSDFEVNPNNLNPNPCKQLDDIKIAKKY